MSDLYHQDFGFVQSNLQPMPGTIASAATIAPTSLVSYVTGTVQIANITPPVTGAHHLYLIFTNAAPGTLLTSGNILTAVVPTQNIPTVLFYVPDQKKYYGWANNLT
jgi:hypothetical protein